MIGPPTSRLSAVIFALAVSIIADSAGAASCSVSSTGLSFGAYDPLPATSQHVDTAGTITVTCIGAIGTQVGYAIGLNGGMQGSVSDRRMSAGSSTLLAYNLYQDGSRSTVWGDGSAGQVVAASYTLVALSRTDDFTIYGRVPRRQNVIPGTYTDSVLVTVTY